MFPRSTFSCNTLRTDRSTSTHLQVVFGLITEVYSEWKLGVLITIFPNHYQVRGEVYTLICYRAPPLILDLLLKFIVRK